MAKKSMIEREMKRQELVKQLCGQAGRAQGDREQPGTAVEERFKAQLKLAPCRATRPPPACTTAAS